MNTELYENDEQKAVVDYVFQNSLFAFSTYFFKVLKGEVFKENWHHHYICSILEDVYNQKLKNVIINISPGSTKSVYVSKMFPAWCYFKNPHMRFIETSYSDELVEGHSQDIKDIIESPEFSDLRPGYSFKLDSNKKKEWTLEYRGRNAGEFLAASMRGKITGKRAGYMESGFTGAIIIDDPLKPDDANFPAKRENINSIIYGTLMSRKANPNVPIVLIMQRLHEDDPTGYLLDNCNFDNWTLIKIPAEIDEEYFEALPEKIKKIAEPYLKADLDKNGVASYWEYKEPIKELLNMRSNKPYEYMSQYMQEPTPKGGTLIHIDKFKTYDELPDKFEGIKIFADTATGIKNHNDYSVFLAVGEYKNDTYLLDLVRGKYEMPDLIKVAKGFYYKIAQNFKNSLFKGFFIEYKSSGPALIQTLKNDTRIPIIDINPTKDKVLRCEQVLPYLDSGRVFIPKRGNWVGAFLNECAAFSPTMSQKHDDQVDAFVHALTNIYVERRVARIYDIYI